MGNNVRIDRVPPQNADAEKAVLGAMLIHETGKDVIAKAVKILGNNAGEGTGFYREAHTKIYQAILRLSSKDEPVDLLTVTQELEANGELEKVGGVSYVDELIDSTPTSANIESYANIVKEQALRRKLIYTSAMIYNKGFDQTEDLSTIISESKKAIYDIQASTQTHEVSIKQELSQIMKVLQSGGLPGIPTGFKGIDQLTCGFFNGEFYVVGGRPRMGKTALALRLIYNLTKAGINTMFVSLEMPIQQLLLRMLSFISQVPYRCFRVDYGMAESAWASVISSASIINDLPLTIDDTPGMTIDQIIAIIENTYYHKQIQVAFIDHMHLIPTEGKPGVEAYTNISLAMKNLARRLNIPIVCLAQLRRLERGNPRPTLQDLRESGGIEQNADHVWLLYNPQESDDFEHKPSIQNVELIIAKNKSLDTGIVNLRFKGAYMEFE